VPIAKFLGNYTPLPMREALVTGTIMSNVWQRWFSRLPETLDSIPNITALVSLDTQAASIATTSLGVWPRGLYRLSYYARITRAASVSSSLTITLAWTDGGIAMSLAGTAITGNTTSSYQTSNILVRSDASTAITYATTYASNAASGVNSMQYSLDLSLEKIRA